jgi:7-keto-8-aminopelargonate synthetase-like enzyme
MTNNIDQALDRVVKKATSNGFINLPMSNAHSQDPKMVIKGKELLSFAFCNYLGLNHDARLKEAAIEQMMQNGTFCSSSRTFLHLDLLEKAEEKVGKIFEKPVVIVPKTTLGHFACMPVLIGPKDAVMLDQQVHATIRLASDTLRANGVMTHTIRHSRLDHLEAKIIELSGKVEKIWYMIDGVFSMFGDDAPLEGILALMKKYEHLHLYVDDAHGMSWAGTHGRGRLLSRMEYHPRLFLLTSLNKAFGADGGVLVCPDQDTKDRIVHGGNTVIFTGPVSPPALGSIMASADIHLSDEIYCLQEKLQERVRFFNETANKLHLPLIAENDTPIFYLGLGKPEVGFDVCKAMMAKGYYLGLALYPAVSLNNTGLRATITLRHSEADIEAMLQTLSRLLPRILNKHRTSMDRIWRYFKMPKQMKADQQD